MSLVLTTSAEILRWAGDGASSTITGSSSLVVTIGENAEKRLCAETRRDWIGQIASVNSSVLALVSKAAAIGAAKEIVNYARSGYFSSAQQLQILNLLDYEYKTAVTQLSQSDANDIRTLTQ